MNKPTLISALAAAALTASFVLPGSASAASFMDQATQQIRGEQPRDHTPRRDEGRRDVERRRDDRRQPAQGHWAPSRYRHDYGHQYRYRYDRHHRPVVRHHYPIDDVRLRILYDLHL